MAYRVMIRFPATVAERDYDMTTKVYLKNIPWNVVRTRHGKHGKLGSLRFALHLISFLTYCRHDRRLELVSGSITSLGQTCRRSGNKNSDETNR